MSINTNLKGYFIEQLKIGMSASFTKNVASHLKPFATLMKNPC